MPRPKVLTSNGIGVWSPRHWGKADAEAVLRRLNASGLSVHAFAMREGLPPHRLYRWRKAFGKQGAAKSAFIEVVTGTTSRLEVVLRSGLVIRVPEGFSAGAVAQLVGALERQGSPC